MKADWSWKPGPNDVPPERAPRATRKKLFKAAMKAAKKSNAPRKGERLDAAARQHLRNI